MRIVALVALCAVAASGQTVEPSTSGGSIKGIVIDESGGPVPAFIRVIETDSGAVVARMRADDSGKFQTGFLVAATYTVTAGINGFRRQDIPGIAVRNGETDVGSIKLAFAGCDAPGVNCDEVTASGSERNKSEPRVTTGELRLKLGQRAETAESRDLQFVKDGAHVYLVAANGAAMAIPNSLREACGTAKYGKARIRADGLGPGIDLCVRHKGGAVSHLFFIEDVEPDSPEINLWVVTRR